MPGIHKQPQLPQTLQKVETSPSQQPEQPKEAQPEKSTKGLLDYPKDLAMDLTEIGNKGVAKNTVEFLDDMKDIKQEGKEFVEHIKEGKILSAAGDGLSMVGNAASGIGNLFQVGVSNMGAGLGTILGAPMNLIDKGAEAAGDATEDAKSFFGKAANFISRGIGGDNSHKGFMESVKDAQAKGIQEAVHERQEADIKWAMKLENKVKEKGYEPTKAETQKYEKIVQKIQEKAKPTPQKTETSKDKINSNSDQKPKVSQDELNWALDLEKKVKEGYQPSPDETEHYSSIYKKMQINAE